MPSQIITLSKQLANQIAAGEVVERPLSVVKELVENSLDAWADEISITLLQWWTRSIEVQDNGAWISPEDMPKALEKYSTSKISNIQDLYNVMTFGFRGEALASISSVSEFTIISKTPEAMSGKKLFTSGWEDIEITDISANTGTTIRSENLFFNTPARMSYLKKDRTEYVKIFEFIQKISLIYPEVQFTLTHDGKRSLHFPKNQEMSERIYNIYGEEFYENMRAVSYMFDGIKISWFITGPKTSFSNKNKQLLFVNHRVIGSPMISKAIFDAYNRFIPHGTQPWYILHIEVDPTSVDVNVHPRKMEVRFANESSLFRCVYHGVKNQLERESLSSTPDLNENHTPTNFTHAKQESWFENKEVSPQYYTGSGTKFKNYSPYKNTTANPAQNALAFSASILWKTDSQQKSYPENQNSFSYDVSETPIWKIIWQMHNSYIVVETSNGIQILDQHALAERVIYEKLSSNSYTPKLQWILGGIWMKLRLSELDSLQEYMQVFESMWFEIEILSAGNIIINAIPDFLWKENIEKIFKNILDDISEIGSKSLDEIRHKIWDYTACRSAVKFWDPLSVFEMQKLVTDASLDYSATCPHGRPVVYNVSLEELQKKYER